MLMAAVLDNTHAQGLRMGSRLSHNIECACFCLCVYVHALLPCMCKRQSKGNLRKHFCNTVCTQSCSIRLAIEKYVPWLPWINFACVQSMHIQHTDIIFQTQGHLKFH